MEFDCSLAQDDAPLRQGDVFVWVDRAYQRPWRTFGVVITADCDLAQNKTKGLLSYLPALTFEDYVWSFWRPERFVPLLDRLRIKAVDRLNKTILRFNPSRKPISEEAGLAWIKRTAPGQLAQEIGLTDPGQLRDFCSTIEDFLSIDQLLQAETPDLPLLNRCHAVHRGKAPAADFADLARDIQSKVSSLPGDVFFSSGVEGFESYGLFIMLRHITQCKIEDVAIKPEELRWGAALARRVARINAPYKAAASQYEADVFVIASRDDTERVRYSGRKILLSTPEYVAGLQFDTVVLVDANKDLVPDAPNAGYMVRRILSELYLGISRAEQRLLIFAAQDAGGISSLLNGAIAKGLIVQSEETYT
ncbi:MULTISPECIES: hypothetical protein [unclassified Bradyrhizobium]|uniref:hypothetical protein n=1 Tax=unclassified Bradyrhizobium TaxID=2631580 RepID=UPI0024795971|nr:MULTISPECIES: hypothetical protein [unclassified Bradyrhizobium]WGR69816.1 hypothetical protein MTX24_31120 [Bradyrhizobium sp. ISRA426]WGR81872.1 hypothetical protein MTX21_16230 [Bradyrhizobium sp. ISRA430]WGR85058.1 hypothetical protein MTX25_30795 [Bradyrhizobium sp. ISRA432]